MRGWAPPGRVLDYLQASYEKHEAALAGVRTNFALRNTLGNEPAYRELLAKLGFEPVD